MMLKGATSVAAVAAIGNFLQGWDGGAIAGMKGYYVFYNAHVLEAMNGYNSSSGKNANAFRRFIPD